jgi:hypothetical protein
MRLSANATPISNTGREEFLNTLDDNNSYHGYPREWFHLTSTDVRLKSDVATRINWNVEEEVAGWLNVNAPAQRLTIDGETYDLHPGFWCSSVRTEHCHA